MALQASTLQRTAPQEPVRYEDGSASPVGP